MKKIVLAVSGASGSIYASRLIEYFQGIKDTTEDTTGFELAVVLSDNARQIWKTELGESPNIHFPVYTKNDYSAPFASGSAGYTHMVIAPCSMGTLGRIAAGISSDLIGRAADVMLKERRQLICVIRESPLSEIHIQNMLTVTRAGGIILPASPSFYSAPEDINALVDTINHRVLDIMGFSPTTFRWGS